jgi:hypothetical protein
MQGRNRPQTADSNISGLRERALSGAGNSLIHQLKTAKNPKARLTVSVIVGQASLKVGDSKLNWTQHSV